MEGLTIKPIDSGKVIEPAEPEILERKKSAQTSLAALQDNDSKFRAALDGKFTDDKEFSAAAREAARSLEKFFAAGRKIARYLERAASLYLPGFERARALEAAEAALKKFIREGRLPEATTELFVPLRETKRGRASREFLKASREREAAEEEVAELKGLA